MCAQTVWHLVYALEVFCTSIPPQQRGLSLGLLSPTGSLPGAHLLSLCLLCLKLSPDCPGCSLCWVTHTHRHTRTHQTHMPVSPGSEIGQEAGLETPLLSLSDALVSPAAYFPPLTHTSRQLPSSTNTDPCWQAQCCHIYFLLFWFFFLMVNFGQALFIFIFCHAAFSWMDMSSWDDILLLLLTVWQDSLKRI